MAKRLRLYVSMLLSTILVSGCWDQVQIEERGFVVGVAVDAPRNENAEEQAEQEAPEKPKGKQRFLVTNQMVIPGGLVSGGQSTSQNTTNEAYLNIVSEGDSLFEVSREFATRASRTPFYQHLKIIIFSEEIARSKAGFGNAIDVLLRDPDARRSTKVFISKGDAKNVIEVKPKTEKLPSLYINFIGENNDRTARMLPVMRIGDVHEQLLNQFSFTLPRITAEKQEVKIAGAALFNSDHIMVGFLGEEETEGLNFLTNQIKGGLLKAKFKEDLGVLSITGAKRSIVADTRNKEHLKFTYQIECEGAIMESFDQIDLLNKQVMEKLQLAFANEIERLCRDTITKVHKQLPVDVIGLGSHLKQYHKDLWKDIKNDWEKGKRLYGKSEIKVVAQVYIRNIGGINRAELGR
ncbi:Ger(x)C family spore germination protein [Brevibacillus centrosporus]|uniref:Ger(x)C family spore germination protein n=1 Tax=Brevibacillus centrosporus TaxID=54910 RepID=UPI003813A6AA